MTIGSAAVLVQTSLPDGITGGPPASVWLLYEVTGKRSLNFTVFVEGKAPTRLPEAQWVSFQPMLTAEAVVVIDKMSEWVDPLDVAVNGSFHLHGVGGRGFKYTQGRDTFQVHTPDVPVVAVGLRSPFPTPFATTQPADGVHSCLVSPPNSKSNNIWGTNYVMWFPFLAEDANTMFRYQIDF